jgi:microcystin-dependent protein
MITLKRNKGSALSHDELDDNFAGSVNIFDAQTVDGVKTFTSSPVVPTPLPGDNTTKVATTAFVTSAVTSAVTTDTVQNVTGQKTFTQLIKTDGIVSILNTNGGSYIDLNDGQISIGTGLNSASNVPEISIENTGYGMSVVFRPSDTVVFQAPSVFGFGINVQGPSGFGDISSHNNICDFLRIYDYGNGLNASYEKTIPINDNSFQMANTAFIQSLLGTSLATKQATLASGTNIKTVNGTSILGAGDITISGGSTDIHSLTEKTILANTDEFLIWDSITSTYKKTTFLQLKNIVVSNTYSEVGSIVLYNNIPTGYLECNGQAISRTMYSALFAVISTTYGAGDGSTTFNLPNLATTASVTFVAGPNLTYEYANHAMQFLSTDEFALDTTGIQGAVGEFYKISGNVFANSTSNAGINVSMTNGGLPYKISPLNHPDYTGEQAFLVSGEGSVNGTGSDLSVFNAGYWSGPNPGQSGMLPMINNGAVGYSQITLADNRVLFMGGIKNSVPQNTTAIVQYNGLGTPMTITTSTPLPSSLYYHRVSQLHDGRILITGGFTSTGAANKTYIGTITGTTITYVESNILPTDLFGHEQTVLLDGRVLITGGSSNTDMAGLSNKAYILTIVGNTILYSDPIIMPSNLFEHRALLLSFGRVLITGGMASAGTPTNKTYFLTVESGKRSIKY